jgi:hypothetical protein
MMVLSQGQSRARLDLDALGLEAPAFFEHRIGAPGPVNGAVAARALVAARFAFLYHGFHYL